jgi:amphi-Trp domain-containing protein
MSHSKTKVASQGIETLDHCREYLDQTLGGLSSGTLRVAARGEEVVLSPRGPVHVSYAARKKDLQESISIELRWRAAHRGVPLIAALQTGARAASVHSLATANSSESITQVRPKVEKSSSFGARSSASCAPQAFWDEMTKQELLTAAERLELSATASMSKRALYQVFQEAGCTPLDGLTRSELYELARTRDIHGRSAMTKGELLGALLDPSVSRAS